MPSSRPRRGEVWFVDLTSGQGSEICKIRPCVVISADGVGALPLKVIVPLTSWQAHFAKNPWMVKIRATSTNGLDRNSAAEALQLRCVDEQRFDNRKGVLTADEMDDVIAAVRLVIDAI